MRPVGKARRPRISGHLGIPLTQVTPIYSVAPPGGLPADAGRTRAAVYNRRGLPRVPDPTPMARWLSMSALWADESVARAPGVVSVRRLWASDVGDGGHHLSGHEHATAHVVPGDLVGHELEERGQSSGQTLFSAHTAGHGGRAGAVPTAGPWRPSAAAAPQLIGVT